MNGSPRPIEQRAQVRALLVRGFSSPQISRMTGIPEGTVMDWRSQVPPMEIQMQQETFCNELTQRNVALGLDIEHKQLEHYHTKVQDQPLSVGEAQILNAMTGTNADKLIAHKTLKLRQGSGNDALELFRLALQELARQRNTTPYVTEEPPSRALIPID